MPSLNDTLAIGRSGLLAHQTRLAVISHNIANVNTPGYHRQVVRLGTNPPNMSNLSEARRYDIGTGVRVLDIVRAYDDTRESLLLDWNSTSELHAQTSSLLPDLQALMQTDANSGLVEGLRQFWASWQDVATHPENLSMRNVLLQRGAALTDVFNSLSENIANYRNMIADGDGTVLDPFTGSVTTTVDDVNRLATEIQSLNQQLARSRRLGITQSDLEDRRDALTLELSGKVNITVGADGTISIDTGVLVSGDGVNRFTLTREAPTLPISLSLDGGATTLAISGGQLGALIQTAGIADTLSDNLDTLADALKAAVNTLHAVGYDLDGNTGVDFFGAGTGAGGIGINAALYNPTNPLLNNPRGVAAAATIGTLGPNTGDGATALAIADLGELTQPLLGNRTFGAYFIGMGTDLGSLIETEQTLADDGKAVVDMLNNAIQSESGVNLDEEMVDMIAAQRAYQASAKVVSTADDMMGTLIAMMR